MNRIRLSAAVFTTAAACAALSPAAQAAPELVVTPSTQTVALGDTLSVDVQATGFADAVVGGGFDFSWDASVLSLQAVAFGPEWDPLASNTGLLDATAGTVTGLYFNTFTGSPSGSFLTATLTFKAVGLGTSAITLAANPLFPFANLAAEEVPFGVVGGTVQAVPEPATVSLLLAGAGVAGWMGRRQRQAGRG
ncbi:MAG: PEP-CTERM sorting domain-containing protein [Burkholderiales bacterium]|nr:PEP-CTERM sorting domain-containing protein [Burkholderiales bacterium]